MNNYNYTGFNKCPICGTSKPTSSPCPTCQKRKEQAEIDRYNKSQGIGTSSSGTRTRTPVDTGPITAGQIIATIIIILVIAGVIFSFTNTGKNVIDSVVGIFGGESAQETAAMNKVRRAGRTDVFMDESELGAKMAEIDTFIASDTSYRMSGTFQFGYPSGASSNSVTTTVTLSYNESVDVYMFIFKNKNTSGYNILEDPKLKGFIVSDGTYYIVRENGITYILSDISGEKKAVSENENRNLLNLLLWHSMGNVVEPAYLLDRCTDEYFENYLIGDDGHSFYRFYQDRGERLNHKFMLITYKNMPVKYEQIGNIDNSDVWFWIEVDYFYDKIPDDNPSVADWE